MAVIVCELPRIRRGPFVTSGGGPTFSYPDRMRTAFDISARYVDDLVAIDPLFATRLGLPGHDHLWPDTGLAGFERRVGLARRTREELRRHVEDPDPIQRRAAVVVTQALDEQIDCFEHEDHLRDLAHMASSFQQYRMVFDTMPTNTPAAWDAISTRLETIGEAWGGLRERLEAGRTRGLTVAKRQVESVIRQATSLAGEDSAFDVLSGRLDDPQLADRNRLERAIACAKAAAVDFVRYLKRDYLPAARDDDGVGDEMYRRTASRFVGIDVDPFEAYAWGWEELAGLLREMEGVARQILPGGSFADVIELLETDPGRAAPSPEAFIAFVTERQQLALRELDRTHFAVAPPLREITVNLAPPGGPLGAYYLSPSEDFTRPGGVWYAVGDQTTFPLYHQVSTAYHEGFPGHHLQVGTAMVNRDRISRAHRLTVWYPGYGEGWALYAERLMRELGYLELPDYVFGMLAKHLYRAARVVVDIGLHLDLPIPPPAPLHGGERWTFDIAVLYLRRFGFRTPDQAVNETMRYLGWPGQAIAYKLGEREILGLREEAQRRLGATFDLATFHDRVIGNGSMRFDALREVVLDDAPAR